MAGILVKAGDNMPLYIQLGDYDEAKFCRAILKDDNGAFIKTVNLIDRGDGTYIAQEPMPSKNVIAVYETYNDAAYTTLSEDHEAGTDIFILDSIVSQRSDDKIIGVIESKSEIVSNVLFNSIFGELSSDEIETTIEGQKQVAASIENFEIEGKLRCLDV